MSFAKAGSSVILDKLRDEGGGGEVCFSFREARRSEAALLSTGFSGPIFWCTPSSSCQTGSAFCPFQLFFLPYMKCILQVFVKFSMKYPWCTKSRRLLKLPRLVLFREDLSVPSSLSAPFLALLWGDPWGSQDDGGEGLESWQEGKSFCVSPQPPAASEGQVEGRRLGLQRSLFFFF